jgi:phosphatidylglycerol---prolipoprotein diacylglyceryl transferase
MILMVATVWIGLTLAEKHSERYGVSKENLTNITFYGILAYIVGGRILFALSNLPVFRLSPISIFSINPDLFDPLGAAIAAVLAGAVYIRHQGLKVWPTLDSLTPLLSMIMIGLALTHLAAGTAFGSPTNLRWGIDLWNASRHPTQIYDLVASILIFFLIWFNIPNSRPGNLFLIFLALTASSRIITEAFRGDSVLVFGGLREAQLVAWVILLASFISIEIILRPKKVDK